MTPSGVEWTRDACLRLHSYAFGPAPLTPGVRPQLTSQQTQNMKLQNAPAKVSILIAAFLFAMCNAVNAQFIFTTNNGALTIEKYTGSQTAVIIPSETNGMPIVSIGYTAFANIDGLRSVTIPNSVTSIGQSAFGGCVGLASLTIPNSVTNIGAGAFSYCATMSKVIIGQSIARIEDMAFNQCYGLREIYFQGNAPSLGLAVFESDNNATVYYMLLTTGWDSHFGGRPTVLWNPQVQTGDSSFGVQNNQFGFNITGSSNLFIVVEACTNLAKSTWNPVGTNTLNTIIGTNGTSYFSDPRWTNYPTRFYRLRSP